MIKKRHIFLFVLLFFLMIFVFMSRGYIGSLVHPLPFDGPYRGSVVDASTGSPISGARIMAKWWCWDFPYPHIGEYFVYAHAITNEQGIYEIKKPKRRGGWFGGTFSFEISAKGYIPVVLALNPNNPPLPSSTKAYPFIDTRSYASLPKSMDIRLNAFKSVLLEALKSENAQYRWMAAQELGKIGKDATYAVDSLILKLKDTDTTVRKYSAKALGRIGSNAKNAVPSLIAALNDKDKWVNLEAIDAIGSIGYADDNTVNALMKLLNDKDSSIRTHAVRSLAKIGHGAKAAVPVLKDMLGEKWVDKYLRREIEYALKKIDPDALDGVSFK